MRPYLTQEKIQKAIHELAQEVKKDISEEIIFVCPLKGSFIFASDFIREFEAHWPVKVDFIRVQTIDNTQQIIKDIELNIFNKTVIILEEIIDAGRKLSFIKQRLLLQNPKAVKIACLIDKPSRRELPITPDYSAFTIDDRFVVGYGMDSDGIGRNYPSLYNFVQ